MALIRVRNESLIDKREFTYLTAASAAAATSLSVIDNNAFANGDYFILGKIGQEATEIKAVNASVTAGTALTTTALTYAHAINTPIYRVDYNQLRIAHSTSTSTADIDAANVATIDIQPDDYYTRYNDGSYTTGYFFVRFYNSTTGGFSDYSAAIPVGGHASKSLWEIARRVYRELGLLKNNDMDESIIKFSEVVGAINDKARDIYHERLWTFAEGEASLSRVANQFKYTLSTSVNQINSVVVDSQPLAYMDRAEWEMANWDVENTGETSHFNLWNKELYLWPKVQSAATATQLNGAISSATATTITVDSTSGFRFAPFARFIIDSEVIYATGSTTTTFTGCLRGQEGTTAATHSDDAAVTERDIVYTYQVEPTDLSAITDLTAVPEPEGLAIGVAAELAIGVLKEEGLHDRLKNKYEEWLGKLRGRYSKKVISGFSPVKDMSQVMTRRAVRNPNDYPQNLS